MQNIVNPDSEKFLLLLGSIILIIIVERIIQWILKNKIKNIVELAVDDVINGLRVIVRLGAGIAVLYSALIIYDLSIESILGLSALIGAIISFGSAQAIQNFIAGIFVLISRPFGIEDFVSISGQEGIVTDISLNYTRLKTIDQSYIYIPNKNILNSTIINYNRKIKKKTDSNTKLTNIRSLTDLVAETKIVRYSFQWGVPLGNLEESKAKLTKICEKYETIFGFRPKFFLENITHRMDFRFIVLTDNANKIMDHLTNFRDDIILEFH